MKPSYKDIPLKELLISIAILLTAAVGLHAQTTTYTGTIKDLSQNVVTSGQVKFTLTPPTDSTLPGVGRFTTATVSCNINSNGSLSGYVAGVVSGPCIVTSNTALSPSGTAYRVCIQPYNQTPGSCFFDYAVTSTKDITTVAPTLATGPLNYNGVPGPPGCVIGSTCTSALTPTSVNTIFYASQYAGADVGAKINAADFAAGTAAADIWVTVAGTVSTVPTISSNHRLILAAPLTWNVAPVLNSNTQILGTGQNALQTVNVSGDWIVAANLSNIAINGVWFSNTFTNPTISAVVLHCKACSGVTMRNNHALAIGLIYTDSSSTTGYSGVNSGNLSQNIVVSDNFLDGQITGAASGSGVVLGDYQFTQNVISSNNVAVNALYNVEWWGGDANVNGALVNTRWANNINIIGGSAFNVRAGFWGSMGLNVTVTGVTVDTCFDVCLDAEGSTNVVFSGFTVHNATTNGGLATFFFSREIEFGPGVVTSDTASLPLMHLHNVSLDERLSIDVKIHNVKFVCLDTAQLCNLFAEPIGGLQFNDNELDNAVLTFVAPNNSGFEISRNRFSYTFAPATAFNAIGILGQESKYKPISSIKGNTFKSSVTQPAGTFAINAAITDFNFSDILYVRDNITLGFTNDANFVADSLNTGITPTFIFTDDMWGANSVTKTITGALGKFTGVDYNLSTDRFDFLSGLMVKGDSHLDGGGHVFLGAAAGQVTLDGVTLPGSGTAPVVVDSTGTLQTITTFSGSKTAGTCAFTIVGGLITAVTGC